MLLSIAAAAAGLLCRGGGGPHTPKGSWGSPVVGRSQAAGPVKAGAVAPGALAAASPGGAGSGRRRQRRDPAPAGAGGQARRRFGPGAAGSGHVRLAARSASQAGLSGDGRGVGARRCCVRRWRRRWPCCTIGGRLGQPRGRTAGDLGWRV